MVLLAVFQCALDDIDPLNLKLWGINISQDIDWVANLSTDLPNTLSPSLHLFLLNNKMRTLIIDCDLCPIKIKGGSIAPFLSLNLSFPLYFKGDGTDGV